MLQNLQHGAFSWSEIVLQKSPVSFSAGGRNIGKKKYIEVPATLTVTVRLQICVHVKYVSSVRYIVQYILLKSRASCKNVLPRIYVYVRCGYTCRSAFAVAVC